MGFIPYGTQEIDEQDIAEVAEALRSDWVTTGPRVKQFEDAFSSYIGCKHAVAVSSGTAALEIGVQALNIPKGSEVITTPFTFVASSNCLLYNNLIPVFVDIDPKTYNLDVTKIEEKITPKTKAILYVDYAGQPCDIEPLQAIAKKHNLFLIEDACHALGAEYNSKKVGTFADLTIFSFHPVKHITTGEGGMITTGSEAIYKTLLMLRTHGIDKEAKDRSGPGGSWEYDMKMLGRNYRITDFQCALGMSQLKKLDAFLTKREELVQKYTVALSGQRGITLPLAGSGLKHAWHLYTILLDRTIDRNQFFAAMKQNGVGTNVHYIPVYRHSYYRHNLPVDPKNFPVTEDVFHRIITLPLYTRMGDSEIKSVSEAVQACITLCR